MSQVAALTRKDDFPSIATVMSAVLRAWPDHEAFLRASLGTADDDCLSRLEEVAGYVLTLAGDDIDRIAADYHWMCDIFREEQFYFARHKTYRRSTIEETIRDVYDNAPYMSRYMNGILLTTILWRNHAQSMDIYRQNFLPGNKEGYEHLDVGPGSGLFLVFAAHDTRCAGLTVWDVSPTSLESTKKALCKMAINRPLTMREVEICAVNPEPDQFDSIICSEVLEHTEQPHKALENLFRVLRPGGRLFLNVPVNSPAPDHIYLWRRPQEIRELVEKQGFEIEDFITLPPTGRMLEQALKQDLDICCIAIARKPKQKGA